MNIAQIIERKGDGLKTVSADSRLRNAMMVMHLEQIGSVVILDEAGDKAIGIISQTQILAAFAKRGAAALDAPVKDVMELPLYCSPTATVGGVLGHMTQVKHRHAIVINDEAEPLGIVSIGDLVASRMSDLQTESQVLRDLARSRLLAA